MRQLSIAESTCAARTVGWAKDVPYGYNLFGITELSKVALERCDSARCAIQTMGDLAVQYGFYSEDSGSPLHPGYADSAETVAVADKYGEVWVFHVLTGLHNASAIWAAQRVPDDGVAVVANAFMIRGMNLSDSDHFMASPNMLEIAQSTGWWTTGDFDFTQTFGYTTAGPLYPLYTGRRVWRVYDLVAPSLHLDSTLGIQPAMATYPFAVRPDAPLKVEDIMHILQDYYQGTPYDMTQGLQAGPFGSPVRYDGPNKNVTGGWERPISMFRTMFSFVLQSHGQWADGVGGVVWYGHGAPHGTVYVPFSCAQHDVPVSYVTGKESAFNPASAWWAFNFVNNWSLLRYNIIRPDIAAEQKRLQQLAVAHWHKTRDEALQETDVSLRRDYLTAQTNAFADQVVQDWWTLAWHLVGKFSDGYILTGERKGEMVVPGYPKWWLEATAFSQWPGTSYQPPGMASNAQWHTPSFLYGILVVLVVVGAVFGFKRYTHAKRKGYNMV